MARRMHMCPHLLMLLAIIRLSDTAVIPELIVIGSKIENIRVKLTTDLEQLSNIEKLTKAYEAAVSRVNFTAIDGSQLVDELANNISDVLQLKMNALNRSVIWAEGLAKDYDWKTDLTMEEVEYIASKKVNVSEPQYEQSNMFGQKVDFNTSSVHIPVEIYEGDQSILNSLRWTNDMDTVWAENREKDPTLLWQYFGAQTGIMRNYPASKWQSDGAVDLFDVRRRPWYTQGASSPKDVIILIDTSGSTYGQALALMKQSVISLLDTLGENDFVNVAHFSDEASWVGCFDTLIQATYRNKQKLGQEVEAVGATGMASYSKGFEFAFKMFEEFYADINDNEGEGADCNRIIMFLTDGGTEMPEEVFAKYNWPVNSSVTFENSDDVQKWRYKYSKTRIFTYAVGPTANPLAAVRWIACHNRGYFYRIRAMGAIRSNVQGYVDIISRPLMLSNRHPSQESSIYMDGYGLGMMTTVTLPVYNRSADTANQTILGVMGSDITVAQMENFIPHRKLGPNGYTFCINANGYIVFHPELKADNGELKSPPNVDLLEVEYEMEEKTLVRREMIDGAEDNKSITTYINLPDGMHVDNKTRHYYYTGISGSSFSVAVVLPDYAKHYVEDIEPMDLERAIELLSDNTTAQLIAPWAYCESVPHELCGNHSSELNSLLMQLNLTGYEKCDVPLLQHLFFDADVTEEMVSTWQGLLGIEGIFTASDGGLTRVYPPSAVKWLEDHTDIWHEVYYRRAVDNDLWMFSAPFRPKDTLSICDGMCSNDEEDGEPLIMITKAVTLSSPPDHKPAVTGLLFSQDQLADALFDLDFCDRDPNSTVVCYYVDDAGFLILSTDPGFPGLLIGCPWPGPCNVHQREVSLHFVRFLV